MACRSNLRLIDFIEVSFFAFSARYYYHLYSFTKTVSGVEMSLFHYESRKRAFFDKQSQTYVISLKKNSSMSMLINILENVRKSPPVYQKRKIFSDIY